MFDTTHAEIASKATWIVMSVGLRRSHHAVTSHQPTKNTDSFSSTQRRVAALTLLAFTVLRRIWAVESHATGHLGEHTAPPAAAQVTHAGPSQTPVSGLGFRNIPALRWPKRSSCRKSKYAWA